MIEKETDFAIGDIQKEGIATRLRHLIGTRSVRAAATAWGLSFSTLNNYLTRGTEPSLNVALKIADVENVTVEWLATGIERDIRSDSPQSETRKSKDQLRMAWMSSFEFMNALEAEALLRIIIRGGARGVIQMASEESDLEQLFIQLPLELKQRAIDIVEAHQNAKKGALEGNEVGSNLGPQTKKKQAS